MDPKSDCGLLSCLFRDVGQEIFGSLSSISGGVVLKVQACCFLGH